MTAIPSSLGEHRTWPLLRRLIHDYVRHHWPRLVFAIACMGVAAVTTSANAWLMQPMLDKVFVGHNMTLLYVIPAALVILALVKGFANYTQAVVMTTVGQRIVADIQQQLFGRLMRADLAFFQANSTGSLISRFLTDTNMLRSATTNILAGLGRQAVTALFLAALMFYQDWVLALVSLAAFPFVIRPISKIGKRMRRVSTKTQVEIGLFTTFLNQVFQGARHVKAYGMEGYEERRAGDVIERLYHLVQRAARVRAISSPMMDVIAGFAIGGVVLYGGHQVIDGVRTPGAFFSFVTALLLAYQPIKSLAGLNVGMQEGLAAAARLFAVLDLEPEIQDRPGARPLQITAGEIALEGVSFDYPNGTRALNDICFTVPAGKRVALVGASGAGKSTILNIIPRFFDVTAGAVLIDGVDIRDATVASVRGAIALVTQEVTMFDDTVRANIAYGRVDATEDEIVAAATAAAADDFIRALPKGYDTLVGEHGIKLSGGQRQRVAIARAMLKNAPLLLLDEATSALDTASERHVQAALQVLMRGRTTLVIAHRLSTVIDADIIYVIDHGRIIERGSHAELLRQGGAYARLHAWQFAGQDWRGVSDLDRGVAAMSAARA